MDEQPDPQPLPGLYRIAWYFYLLLASVAVVWIGVREGGFGLDLFLPTGPAGDGGPGWRELAGSLALDVVLGLASVLFLLGAWELTERTVASARELGRELRTTLSSLSPAEAVGLALLSGLSEELFFRGAVQMSWEGWPGWLGATAVFALLHSGPGRHFRWWTLFAVVAGGLMGLLTLWRGTLTAAVVAHVGVNGVQLLRATLGEPPPDEGPTGNPQVP